KYYLGDFVVYKESAKNRIGRILSIIQKDGYLNINIQRILIFEELPRNLQSNSHKERSIKGEIWMLDRNVDNAIKTIELQIIIKHNYTKILLKKRIPQRNIENLIPPDFKEQLELCYEDLGFNSEYDEVSFSIVHALFRHKKDKHYLTFIIIDWFESTNQTKLGCPLYRLETTNCCQKIFPVSVVKAVNTVHFVHNCKDEECIEGQPNDLYIRNLYFFKAI
ncbi:17230_t:CDS:2, partial [Dentiscutata erythropus]